MILKNRVKNFFKKSTITKESGLYKRMHEGKEIISPDQRCLLGIYSDIFEREIYWFESENEMPLIIDCGSNIGLGIIYWKGVYPKSKIIAFEPSSEVFKCLNRNIKSYNYSNIDIKQLALSSYDGIATFNTNEALSGSLNLSKNLESRYEVEVSRLSHFIPQGIIVDFLKIDIEGEELIVLEEIGEKIAQVRNIFVEYHSFVSEPQKLSRVLEILESYNFRYLVERPKYKFQPINVLKNSKNDLNQDLQLNIYAINKNKY